MPPTQAPVPEQITRQGTPLGHRIWFAQSLPLLQRMTHVPATQVPTPARAQTSSHTSSTGGPPASGRAASEIAASFGDASATIGSIELSEAASLAASERMKSERNESASASLLAVSDAPIDM
jgi:hypothetical protein